MIGYIKIYRQLLKWEWYDDINVCRVFIHCLLRANWTENNWKGQQIERGKFVTSMGNLAAETGLSVQQTRTALSKLKSTNEITIKTTNKNSVIGIVKYDLYQGDDKQVTSKTTIKQQTNNKQTNIQITTNKEDKNIRIKETIERAGFSNGYDEISKEWSSYLSMRKTKFKDKLTDESQERIMKMLFNTVSGNSALAIATLQNSTDNGWKKFVLPKPEQANNLKVVTGSKFDGWIEHPDCFEDPQTGKIVIKQITKPA